MIAATSAKPDARAPRWIRSAPWDLALLTFCWVPQFLWVVFGLHLDRGGSAIVGRPEFQTAMIVTLAFTFAHRQYVFLMVFGDGPTFRTRPWSFLAAPVALIGVTALAFFAYPKAPQVWQALLVVGAIWNIWHAVMQRFGLSRMYAGRAGAGLQDPRHARREFGLVWSAVLLVVVAVPTLRLATLRGHPATEAVLAVLAPALTGPAPKVWLACASLLFLGQFAIWTRHELAAPLTLAERMPRLTFLASTAALLAIVAVYGPIVGYLVFGFAHAAEYIAFVHHFAGRKFAHAPAKDAGLAALTLRHPLASAIAIVPACVALYVFLRRHDLTITPVFVVYEVSFAMVHFAYDGWVWKARDPSVGKPLGIAS